MSSNYNYYYLLLLNEYNKSKPVKPFIALKKNQASNLEIILYLFEIMERTWENVIFSALVGWSGKNDWKLSTYMIVGLCSLHLGCTFFENWNFNLIGKIK